MRILLSVLTLSLPSLAIADTWTEKNITKAPLQNVICNETQDEDYGHGGYFVTFPSDPVSDFMIIGLDKSDDTEHLIGGYDIRVEKEVKLVARGERNVKALSIKSEMSGVETQINLAPLLKVMNSSNKKNKPFPATLIFPTGNIQEFKLSCEFRR